MSEINAAGEAFAEDDLYDMTDDATRVTWTDAGIKAFLESLRRLYGDDFVDRLRLARIESDARAGDAANEAVWTTPCPECFEEQAVKESGVGYGGRKWSRLTCGHLTFRSPPGATS